MSKTVQNYNLFQALKSAGNKGLSKEQIAQTLNISLSSASVYVFSLKKRYPKLDIEAVREGRAVTAYVLKNPDLDAAHVPAVNGKRGAAAPAKAAKATKVAKAVTKATADKGDSEAEVKNFVAPDEDLEITRVSSREMADIRSMLGV